jgi:NAD(P)-dependent dehydrogenase (short-subunit alcohol dehydrogenase family)
MRSKLSGSRVMVFGGSRRIGSKIASAFEATGAAVRFT